MSVEEALRKVVLEALEERLRPLEAELARLRTLQSSAPTSVDDDPGDLLSLAECEEVGGYKPNTVRKAIRQKKLAAVKGKKEWRVKRGDLLAWIAKRPVHTLSSTDVAAKADRLLARAVRR